MERGGYIGSDSKIDNPLPPDLNSTVRQHSVLCLAVECLW